MKEEYNLELKVLDFILSFINYMKRSIIVY